MRNNLLSIVSILLSISCLIIISKINYDIASVYRLADGKTQALFGVIELTFLYKYYFLVLGAVSLVIAFVAKRKMETKIMARIAICMSLLSILIVFFRIWKLMI